MIHKSSYHVASFATNTDAEIRRLNAQVDLFWKTEFELFKRYGLQDGMNLLDCGCGPGHLIELLKNVMPNLICTGLEMDPYLVETARGMLQDRRLDHCRILTGTAEKPDLPESSFDFIILRLVLEHVPEPVHALRSLKRLLRPKGRMVIIANDFEYHLRTWPAVPQLDLLYKAYCTSREKDGGDPRIGRRLPRILSDADMKIVGYEIEVAHNAIIGDKAFLQAEGAGIPAQLVKTGFLAQETLEEMTRAWREMLLEPQHSMMRPLFVCIGEKYTEFEDKLNSQKSGAPEAQTQHHDNNIEPVNLVLEKPQEILASICNLAFEVMKQKLEDPDKNKIDPEDILTELGMDSLTALDLQEKIKKHTAIEIPIVKLLDNVNVQALADYVSKILKENKVAPVAINSSLKKNLSTRWEEGEI